MALCDSTHFHLTLGVLFRACIDVNKFVFYKIWKEIHATQLLGVYNKQITLWCDLNQKYCVGPTQYLTYIIYTVKVHYISRKCTSFFNNSTHVGNHGYMLQNEQLTAISKLKAVLDTLFHTYLTSDQHNINRFVPPECLTSYVISRASNCICYSVFPIV